MNRDKVVLRAALLARRSSLNVSTLATAAAASAEHLVGGVVRGGANRVCAYVPVGTEPGSIAALDELRAIGVEVLLPLLRPDLDLDWAPYEGPEFLVRAARGLLQPAGRLGGIAAISGVDLVIVPALAVDAAGNRLGRGGGSYDRALARVRREVPVVALLHDGEVVAAVPHDEHDRPVTHTVTPTGGWQPVDA